VGNSASGVDVGRALAILVVDKTVGVSVAGSVLSLHPDRIRPMSKTEIPVDILNVCLVI
jgi:hypothetical protein